MNQKTPEPTPLEQLGPRTGEESPHELIYRAYLLGWIHFGTKLAVLNRPGSPVFNAYENWGPVAIILFLSLYTGVTSGLGAGLSLLAAGVLFGLMILPKWVLKKLRMRVIDMAFGSEQGWIDLWRNGGVSMRLASDVAKECDSPDGDWRSFAREHFDRPDDQAP